MSRRTYQPQPLPEIGFVRLPSILAVIPVSRSTWLAGVKSGKYPAPVKLGPGVVVWKVEEIRELIRQAGEAVGRAK